jgi:hypothetical protein
MYWMYMDREALLPSLLREGDRAKNVDERLPAVEVASPVTWIVQPRRSSSCCRHSAQAAAGQFYQIECRGGVFALDDHRFDQDVVTGRHDLHYRRANRLAGAFMWLLNIARCCETNLEYWT